MFGFGPLSTEAICGSVEVQFNPNIVNPLGGSIIRSVTLDGDPVVAETRLSGMVRKSRHLRGDVQ